MMGRQLKRVPLDFQWPLRERWKGFLNPHYEHRENCDACDGTGYSPAAKLYQEQWYGNAPFDPAEYGAVPLTIDSPVLRESVERKLRISQQIADQDGKVEWYTQGGVVPFDVAVNREIRRMFGHQRGQWCHHLIQADVDALIEAGRLHDFTHDWKGPEGGGWQPKVPAIHPTADEVNAWSFFGMSHDSINAWICVKARCARDSQPASCDVCHGEGDRWTPPEAKQWAEDWQEEEPPTGEGYQLWETVSEGSPVTPVFAFPEELAEWLVQNDTSVTKDTTYDQWMRFIVGEGWAPSLISTNGRMQSGVKSIGTQKSA